MTPLEATQLYNQYHISLFHTCLRIVGNREDAEECMQNAFVKLFDASAPVFVSPAARYAWLKKVAVRESIDALRRVNWRAEAVEVFGVAHAGAEVGINAGADLVANAGADLVADAATAAKVQAVKAALQRLPVGYRTILSLYLFEGYDFDEIASILNVKPSSVRSQYARGRQKIQDEFRKIY